MSRRGIEQGLESAVGHFLLSQRTVREMAESRAEGYEAFRTRDLRQEPGAYLFRDTVSEPFRRWGQRTGGLCGWAICEDGRKVLLSLSTANRESCESCREV
jgi:transposase-like protein